MCGNVLCWKKDRARGPCNEIRIIEFILCVVCFGLSIYFVEAGAMPVGVFLTLFCIMIFIFITLVDIIVITIWYPIGWRAWILISLTASLFFFTCTGLSLLIDHSLFFIGTIFYVITAIVFLLDCLCIIWLVQGAEEAFYGSRPCIPTVCRSAQVVPITRPCDPRAYSLMGPVCTIPQQSQQTQYTASSRSDPKCHRWKEARAANTTYGGTFHVSKDRPPMPTPRSMTHTISDVEYDTMNTEEDVPRKVRTVGVMTRMVSRKCRQEVDLTPLKSPFAQEETTAKRPPRKLRRVSFSSCREKEDCCKHDSINSNSNTNTPRSVMDSDKSSLKCNQQMLSKSNV